jgi:hypothetical protein
MQEFSKLHKKQGLFSMERNQPSEPTTRPSDRVNPLYSTRTQQTSLTLHNI